MAAPDDYPSTDGAASANRWQVGDAPRASRTANSAYIELTVTRDDRI
jgi:hypothetical protein